MPLQDAILYVSIEVVLIYFWILFLGLIGLNRDKTESKPFEIKLTQKNYPFEEGSDIYYHDYREEQ